jgi:anaerobic selenocysteine-containing dehydrogenase
MGFTEPCFRLSEFEIMREALHSPSPFLAGLDLAKLQAGETVKLNLPECPNGGGPRFSAPSGKVEFYSESMAKAGFDPLPNYTPCSDGAEASATNGKSQLQLLVPPAVHFLNTTFGAVEGQRRRMGRPTLQIHPEDAGARGIRDGDQVRVSNGRGECRLFAQVTEDTRPGVVVAESIWWPKHSPDGRGFNTLVSTRLTDLGEGSTFQCNLVEVKKE